MFDFDFETLSFLYTYTCTTKLGTTVTQSWCTIQSNG